MILELPEIFIKKEGMRKKLVAEKGISSTYSKREINDIGFLVTATEFDTRKPPVVAVFDARESKDIKKMFPEELFKSITVQKFEIVGKYETRGLPYLIPVKSECGKPVDASDGKNIIPEKGLVSSNRLRNIQTDSLTRFEVQRNLSLRDEELDCKIPESREETFFEEIYRSSQKSAGEKQAQVKERRKRFLEEGSN